MFGSVDLRLFGLSVRSTIAVPAYIDRLAGATRRSSAGAPDVTIAYGQVAFGNPPTPPFRTVMESPDSTVVHLKGLGRIAIEDGERILVDPEAGADVEGIALCVFGIACAYLLLQRGRLPLHASGLLTDAGVIALMGRSGSGKSTTAAALQERGHKIVGDDLIGIDLSGGRAEVVGQDVPHLKLWTDAASHIAFHVDDMCPLREGVPRLSKPRRQVPFEHAPLAACVLLEFDPTVTAPRLLPLSPFEAVAAMRTHLFGHRHLRHTMGEAWLLERQTRLARGTRFARLIRPRTPEEMPACLDLIERFAHAVPSSTA